MRLLSLKLRNFKGIAKLDLVLNGADADILGDNGAGKTTVNDALRWLLFEKDSADRKEFDIKTIDRRTGEPLHNLEHEVEGVFDLEPGRLTLRKVYYEVYTKRRGSARAEFTGHTTDFYIDGVPVKRGEYLDRIAGLMEEDRFKLLTDPTYFAERLPWQQRRKLLLEVCGDVTLDEVIASSEELAKLPEILGNHAPEDYRKILTARRKEVNDALERIPVRVDEVNRGIPEIPEGTDREALAARLEALRAKRREKDAERSTIENGGATATMRKRIAEIDAELQAIKTRVRAAHDEAVAKERAALRALRGRVEETKATISRLEREKREASEEAVQLEARRQELLDEFHREAAREFSYSAQTVCPSCEQPLPAERLQAAREKAESEFNLLKSKRLEEINERGRAVKRRLDEIHAADAEREPELEAARAALAELEAQSAALLAKIEVLETQLPDPSKEPGYKALADERDQLAQEIDEVYLSNVGAIQKANEAIRAIDAEVAEVEGLLAKIEQKERAEARIAELGEEEKRLAGEFETVEYHLYLLDLFERTKVEMLDHKINSRFTIARFRLFKEHINGGLEPCCEVLCDGVPFTTALNTGARINVGLDIINTLSEHFGFVAPIVIDNRESVTRLIPTRAQVISLIVSEQDRTLRVVVKEPTAAVAV